MYITTDILYLSLKPNLSGLCNRGTLYVKTRPPSNLGFADTGNAAVKILSSQKIQIERGNLFMTKTSATKPLRGFEWDYTGTVAIFKQEGYQGNGVSRTMFFSPGIENLANLPAELFMVKISQSPKPELAGKATFRFLSFKLSEDAQYNSVAPEGISLTTPLEEIKSLVVSKLSSVPGAQVSVATRLHGRFTSVATSEGNFNIYDEERFPSNDWRELGDPSYYLRNDVEVTVTLKGAESHGNEYLQTRIKTTLSPDEVFQKRADGKIWGEDDGGSTPNPVDNTPADTAGGGW